MRAIPVFAAATVVGAAALWGVAAADGSSPLAPASMLVVFPALLLAGALGGEWIVPFLIPGAVATVYLLFSNQLLRGVPRIPIRAWILLGLAVLGSALWFSLLWSYGVRFQGLGFTIVAASINAAMAVLLAIVGSANRRNLDWLSSYCFHTLLFLWLGWLSFPWLGEMP